GASYYSYQWLRNGVAVPGASHPTLVVSTPGSYSVVVKGSQTISPFTADAVTIYGDPLESQNLNFITTTTFLNPVLGDGPLHTINPEDYVQSTDYYDGLGRPMQKVDHGASPAG